MPKQNGNNRAGASRKSTQNKPEQPRDPREMTIEERLRALRQHTVEVEAAAEPEREEARPARVRAEKGKKEKKAVKARQSKQEKPKQEKQKQDHRFDNAPDAGAGPADNLPGH